MKFEYPFGYVKNMEVAEVGLAGNCRLHIATEDGLFDLFSPGSPRWTSDPGPGNVVPVKMVNIRTQDANNRCQIKFLAEGLWFEITIDNVVETGVVIGEKGYIVGGKEVIDGYEKVKVVEIISFDIRIENNSSRLNKLDD